MSQEEEVFYGIGFGGCELARVGDGIWLLIVSSAQSIKGGM